ncbi:MLL1 [Mytilus coruscus]|uniref:MLL1 n=1 Tax=Mytilus coruscus TaxID=42192 RepID=A0A6J8C6N8_MYTCO|nr:MLL1 [Mytilus coruscus]
MADEFPSPVVHLYSDYQQEKSTDLELPTKWSHLRYIKKVAWNAKAIQCDGCDIWIHSKCANIVPHSLSLLQRTSLNWICTCTNCGIPSTSLHHKIDLDDFSSINVYSPPLSKLNSKINNADSLTNNTDNIADANKNIASSLTPCLSVRPKLNNDMQSITHHSLSSSHGDSSIMSEPESPLTSEIDNVFEHTQRVGPNSQKEITSLITHLIV